jgi:hypothetical protein
MISQQRQREIEEAHRRTGQHLEAWRLVQRAIADGRSPFTAEDYAEREARFRGLFSSGKFARVERNVSVIFHGSNYYPHTTSARCILTVRDLARIVRNRVAVTMAASDTGPMESRP